MNIKPGHHRIYWGIGALTLVLILIGVGSRYWNQRGEIQHPRIGTVIEAIYGLGTVVASQTYQVKTAINQGITEIYVKEGDSVTAGSPLLKFDDTRVIRAPFAGTVTSIPFKRGEILFQGTAGLTLVNLLHPFLEVSLEQQSVLRIQRGQPAVVSFESIRGERVDAKVESVFPRDSQFIVRVRLDKIPAGILPGMTADVAIEVGRKENVLSIPFRSISSGRVTIRRNGKRLKQTIEVGVVDLEWAEVKSGDILASDEILVRAK